VIIGFDSRGSSRWKSELLLFYMNMTGGENEPRLGRVGFEAGT
jgi:hypothetical protein